MDQHKLTLQDIQGVIDKMGPLEGAVDFVAWLRERLLAWVKKNRDEGKDSGEQALDAKTRERLKALGYVN